MGKFSELHEALFKTKKVVRGGIIKKIKKKKHKLKSKKGFDRSWIGGREVYVHQSQKQKMARKKPVKQATIKKIKRSSAIRKRMIKKS